MSAPFRAGADGVATHAGIAGVSAWSIRNPIPVSLLFLALIVGGIWAYFALPIKNLPVVSSPVVSVSVTQGNASPAELETQVTKVVENAVAGLAGVRHVTSSVVSGSSTTTVEFRIGEDEQRVAELVRGAVDRVRADLPRTIDEPIVERVEADAAPIMTFAVAAPAMSERDLSWFIDDVVARRVQAAPGVARVQRVGGAAREFAVVLDPARLAAHGVDAAAVNEAVRASASDSPGGRAALGGHEQQVRVSAAVGDRDRLEALAVPVGGGRFVTLSDLGYVSDGTAEQRSFARLDGRPVVGFQVSKTRRASDIAVEDAVGAAVAALAAERRGVTFTEVVSTVTDTRDSYASAVTVLIEGMVLAAIIVFVFLRDWRSTAISALAMPISLIPTFIVMMILGFTLNTITLLGLTLVIGILVDDAIVEVENIEKRIERGERPYEAALHGADAIGLAVVATTFAIVAVFAPVSLIGGVAGQYFTEFGATVSVAVLFSLLVARMLTPLMAAYFLSPSRRPHERKPFEGWYRDLLEFALRRRGPSVLAALAFLLGSVWLASTLPAGFTPEGNPNTVPLRVQGPSGASPAEMAAAVARLDRALRTVPEVRSVFVEVGSGGDPAAGSATLILDPARGARTDAVKRALRPVFASVPDLRVSMLGAFGTPDVETILTGSDEAALAGAAADLERQMRGVPGLRDVRPAVVPSASEIVVRPRVAVAARLGVSAEAIADTVRVATTGDVDANVAKASVDGRRLPIRVLVAEVARGDFAAIGALRVPTASGGAVPLAAVADLAVGSGPSRIERFDRLRRATVQADLDGITLGQATSAVAALPVMRSLSQGVSQIVYGDAQAMAELFGGFIGAMAAGVGLIFAVLVLLFGSFFKPVTILTALPLSIGGAVIGLWLFAIDFNLPALIGILMLLGLAAKNSILLVEFAIEAERGGMSQHDALIEACRARARPIVMTTVAMAAGMVPAAIGLADTGGFMRPMAVAVIGGLISSTALSLVLVPVVYAYVDDFEIWLRPKLAGLVTSREAPTMEPRTEHARTRE